MSSSHNYSSYRQSERPFVSRSSASSTRSQAHRGFEHISEYGSPFESRPTQSSGVQSTRLATDGEKLLVPMSNFKHSTHTSGGSVNGNGHTRESSRREVSHRVGAHDHGSERGREQSSSASRNHTGESFRGGTAVRHPRAHVSRQSEAAHTKTLYDEGRRNTREERTITPIRQGRTLNGTTRCDASYEDERIIIRDGRPVVSRVQTLRNEEWGMPGAQLYPSPLSPRLRPRFDDRSELERRYDELWRREANLEDDETREINKIFKRIEARQHGRQFR
ncbi:MAG: hypothetical protein Q9216_002733 [Gyalolechia sp. 2 TL-2023]